MTNNDELRPYFLGDICNFLSRITPYGQKIKSVRKSGNYAIPA